MNIASVSPSWADEDVDAVLPVIGEILRSGHLVLGPHTEHFEKVFANFVGATYAVAVSSGTAALELALEDIFDDTASVLMPSNNCTSVAAAVRRCGYLIDFCEADSRDFCIDVDDALDRLTDKTDAVLVTAIAGFVPHGIERLEIECARRDIRLIEDGSHAPGASLGTRMVGSFGTAGCFSLYPTKVLTCGGVGGVLTTNDEGLYRRAISARKQRHVIASPWVIDEIRAALALRQLKRLPENLAARRRIARAYDEVLASTPVRGPIAAHRSTPAYYKYPVLLPLGAPRGEVVRARMREHGIAAGALYDPPLHRQPVFLPETEALLTRQVCLPMHHAMKPDDCREIVDALVRCLE